MATFKGHDRPLTCCMIQAKTPERVFEIIKGGNDGGCDAFGYQHCKLDHESRTEKNVRSFFEAMDGKPVYVTNYRSGQNKDMTDDELGEGLIQLAGYGATLCDIMGDLYCKHPKELTDDKTAIEKQMKLIDRIHNLGGEVLMSSHVCKYTPAEEVIEIALEQQRRGADVVKIVTSGNSEAEQLENLRITSLLKEALDVPFLYLSGGSHSRLHRTIGPMLGCIMSLCVWEHDELSTKAQPLLADEKAILKAINYISK